MKKDMMKKPLEGGLELDKIDIRPSPPPLRAPVRIDPLAASPEKTYERSRFRWIVPAAIASALLLGLILGAIHMRKAPTLSSIQWDAASSGISEKYLTVGPVYATLANKDVVFLVVQIGCATETSIKKLSGMESLLKNSIITVMGDPETGKLFAAKDYNGLRARLRDGISAVAQEPIGEVYFSQLLRF